ncbi:replication initiation protein [Mucilaginibacter lappiensis]|uniref:Plasmid replication initiation protein n=1 Tax=Mucilaginibacter lappiensis TaxID=354630 RepID=A0A841JK21_9SPHI|nr:replication initiation protein [Mucilaginibacter lappiensis]MBB6131533.1 plasmid replication initiation protein [Mucilaginibacter lappiensis]
MVRQKKKEARIPVVVPGVFLVQPNRVTQTSFKGFTLMMHRIFTAIVLSLQDAIQYSMKNPDVLQLDLFTQSSDDIFIRVPYSMIIKDKTHYNDVRKALSALATLGAEIPYTDESGKKRLRFTGLLRADIPEKADFSSVIDIKIDKKMAKLLVEIDKNEEQTPINYTKYSYDVAQAATCTHTPPLYKLLSSWKLKGGLTISLKDLRENLGISEDQYKRYPDFKKRVLEPVQDDLIKTGDCWFNCNIDGFKTKRKGELWLNFKIITPQRKDESDKKTEMVKAALYNFGLTHSQLASLNQIFDDDTITREKIMYKISEIEDFMYKNNIDDSKDPILNKPAYMLSSLKKAFLKAE